nr:outer membrane beta-barrel protein [Bacteroidota bacterium]
MDKEKRHIDDFFKKYLIGYQSQAPDNAWEKLNNSLHPMAKKRSVFWYTKLAAASVLLLLAFGAGYFLSEYSKSDINENLTEVSTENISEAPSNDQTDPEGSGEKTVESNQKTETLPANQFEPLQKPLIPTRKNEQLQETQQNFTNTISTSQGRSQNLQIAGLAKKIVNRINLDDHTGSHGIIDYMGWNLQPGSGIFTNTMAEFNRQELEQMTPEELHALLVGDSHALADEILADAQKQNQSNWSIGGQISPVYSFRTLSGNAIYTPDEEIPKDYLEDIESGIVTIAGGINLSYSINNRLSLGSGLYLSRIGQENNDVVAYDAQDGNNLFKLATSGGTVTINPTKFERVMVQHIQSPKDSIPGDYTINGTFVQNLDYLEVPMILKYRLLDKKFSINLLGGLSPGILVNNRSYFSLDGNKIETGTTENIKPMIYNSVVGIGLQYLVSKKLTINFDPVFKYSLSPVNSGSSLNYHPYSISWFTGISYKL